jgi:hypothetical protein
VIRTLSRAESALVDQAILEYIAGCAPLRAGLIAYGVTVWMQTRANNKLDHVVGKEAEFRQWCGPALQRLKRAGRVSLVRGDGGGWRSS